MPINSIPLIPIKLINSNPIQIHKLVLPSIENKEPIHIIININIKIKNLICITFLELQYYLFLKDLHCDSM